MFLLLHLLAYRRKLFFLFVFLVALGVLSSIYFTYNDLTQGPSVKINDTEMLVSTLPDIESSFQSMEDKGIDVNKPLIYGYYFYDHDKNKLLAFSKVLQKEGFYIGILDESATYSSDHQYLLYVTETTIHTPQSLLKQCNRLTALAVKNHIEDFDGWEAGEQSLDGQKITQYQD
ncbi:MAG TPA: ribonuclease E inhibitor RraB [Candidatus Saccharimonadales bacterium]|nr:ribonuclease E inhibitor RraB [Candidatus Saccharimonadales bacterium]